jgi:hypothetical protein
VFTYETSDKEKIWDNLIKISDYYKSLFFFEQKAMTVQLNYLLKNMRTRIKEMYTAKKIPYVDSLNEKREEQQQAERDNEEEGGGSGGGDMTPDPDDFKKLIIYSGHDVNMWAMFKNFGLTCSQCLKNKIEIEEELTDSNYCLGNTDFATSIVILLKRPVPTGNDPVVTDNIYAGKKIFKVICRGISEQCRYYT